ncbi:hypothetical protein [Noviherbaspirillum pedocola]|uniref:Uncharacterized protein n=1 Tax=Noviherbaspirillum pedocola TaxID=2801341 RepID=A0A934SQI4_9BURK|nr:hypothetical protein [Noviherbaspirillum pedocola]MBK4733640.1 hypothetical protein [Noviherbaspirillum pedocola]
MEAERPNGEAARGLADMIAAARSECARLLDIASRAAAPHPGMAHP